MGFNGTPFNDDQLDHMRSIAAMPEDQVSWCGWGRAGDPWCCMAADCEGKTKGKTLADRRKVECPFCGNYPRNDEPIVHVVTCRSRERAKP